MEGLARNDGTDAAPHRGGGRTAAIATLAVAALALAAALAATLSHAAVRDAGTNDVTVQGTVGALRPGHRVCQAGERLPADTQAIVLRASRAGSPLPTLAVEVTDAATRAAVAAGSAVWTGVTATAHLRPAPARERAVRVCLTLRGGGAGARATLFGAPAGDAPSATDDGVRLGGRVRFDYKRAGAESWWALAPTVVRRIGLVHPWSGASVALLAGLLTLTSIAVATWLVVRTS